MNQSSESPDNFITDDMLIRMVALVLKDISHIAPFEERLARIVKEKDHPAMVGAMKIADARIAELALRARRKEVEAVIKVIQTIKSGVKEYRSLLVQLKDPKAQEAVSKAMQDLGLEEKPNELPNDTGA